MILSELTGYLAKHRRVALMDMSNRFGSSPDALRGMLATLERKGRVRRIEAAATCATGCGKCDISAMETYEWLGSPQGEGERGCA
jgi:putative ferrous iron transport protein C